MVKKAIIILMFGIPIIISISGCNTPSGEKSGSANQMVDRDKDNYSQSVNIPKYDDSQFMMQAASGSLMEIEAGKLAKKNAQSKEVSDFASRMIIDHTKANEELKALAVSKNISLPLSPETAEVKHLNEIGSLKGKDFDQQYVNMMISDHEKTINMFEDQIKHGSDVNVRKWATQTLPVLKEHRSLINGIKGKM
jgi:putative membrane protein